MLDRFADLDALRGIAVAQVLLWHLWVPALVNHAPRIGRWLGLSWTGVDLFFVLSGYLIAGILLANRDANNFYAVFYGRRVLRIIPLYAALLAGYVLMYHGSMVGSFVTFTQNFAWASDRQIEIDWAGWMGPTWSLAVEEQFYLVLPLLIRLTPAKRVPWLFAALVAAAPLCRVAAVSLYGQPYAAYLLMPCRMDALFGGALLAWATAQPRCVAWLAVSRGLLYALIAVLAAGVLLMLARGLDTSSPLMWGPGYSWIAAFYASLLLAVVTRPNRATPPWIAPLGWLGVHAYALYLFHRPIEILAHGLLPKGPAVPIAATLGALALAALCWGVVEQPAIALGRRALRYDRDTAAPARRHERHSAVKIQ